MRYSTRRDTVLQNSCVVDRSTVLRTLPDDARPIHSLLLVERRFAGRRMLSSAPLRLRSVGVTRAMLRASWADTIGMHRDITIAIGYTHVTLAHCGAMTRHSASDYRKQQR